MHQPVDPGVGFEVFVAPGDGVEAGQPLGTVHARDEEGARLGAEVLIAATHIGDEGEPVVRRPLVSRL
jgi:thymidine phosphorylase